MRDPAALFPERAELGPGSSVATLPPSGMTVIGGGCNVAALSYSRPAFSAMPERPSRAARASATASSDTPAPAIRASQW
jgi:hypothetical protein